MSDETENDCTATFIRTWITGTLTCESPLHLGCGEFLEISTRDCSGLKSRKGDVRNGLYAAVYTGHDRKPRIPAASLRGALRARVVNSDDIAKKLFGYAEKKDSRAGALRVCDATLLSTPACNGDLSHSPTRQTVLQQGVAIDPVTGTARAHHLFSVELVPAGSRFHVRLVLHKVGNEHLEKLLALLDLFDGSPAAVLGAGRNRGWGRVRWELEAIKVLDQQALSGWLLKGGDMEDFAKPASISKAGTDTAPMTTIPFTIEAQTPFLINDPARVKDQEGEPDLEFMRTPDGKALIPGSTLRGWLRARCRRILATIAHLHHGLPAEEAAKQIDPLLEQLFGRTSWRSPIWISNAVSDESVNPHEQFFNAIDRFTGGVADGALYQVNAAPAGTKLRGACHLETNRLPEGDWWKGLLLLAARDANDGELLLGWGKAKGYGTFRLLEVQDHENLEEIKEAGKQWIKDLHKEIKENCNENKTEEGQAAVREETTT